MEEYRQSVRINTCILNEHSLQWHHNRNFSGFSSRARKTPQMYYIGLHDNLLFIKLNIGITHYTICWNVSQTSLNSIVYTLKYTPAETNIRLSSQYTKLIGSISILYKILTFVNVDTFKVSFPALPDRPEKLRLTSQYDLMIMKEIFTLIHIRKNIYKCYYRCINFPHSTLFTYIAYNGVHCYMF